MSKLLDRFNLSDGARLTFSAVIDRYGEVIAREAIREWGRYPSSLEAFETKCQELARDEVSQRAAFLLAEFLYSERRLGVDWASGFKGAETVDKAIALLGGYPQAVTYENGGGIEMRNRLKAKIMEILEDE